MQPPADRNVTWGMVPWGAAAGLCVGPVHLLTVGLSTEARAVAVFASSLVLVLLAVAAKRWTKSVPWQSAMVLGASTWYGIFATTIATGIFDRQTFPGVCVLYLLYLVVICEDLTRQAYRDHHNAASGERAAVEGE